MQFANYFAASLISFAGLFVGIALVRAAPEEKKPLNFYFEKLRIISLALVFAFIGFYYYASHFNLFIILAYFAFALLIEYYVHDLTKKSTILYGILGILFFMASSNVNLFVLVSSLTFFYGVAASSLEYSIRQKNHYRILFYNSIFVIIANGLLLV